MDSTMMLGVAVAILLASAALQVALALAGRRPSPSHAPTDTAYAALRANLDATTQELRRLQERLQRLERAEPQMNKPPASATPAAADTDRNVAPSDPTYQVAANLVRQGASLDDLLARCALTRGEAELIMRLYRPAKPGSAAATAAAATHRSGRSQTGRFQTLC